MLSEAFGILSIRGGGEGGGGFCLLGGVCLMGGFFLMDIPLVVTSSGNHCSGRYASYWNALLSLVVSDTHSKSKKKFYSEVDDR